MTSAAGDVFLTRLPYNPTAAEDGCGVTPAALIRGVRTDFVFLARRPLAPFQHMKTAKGTGIGL